MLSSFSSQVLATKVKARYGRRLTPAQYSELSHKHSISEAAGYLKTLPGYSQILKEIPESTVHRGQLEYILRRSLFLRYLELLNYNFEGKDSYYAFFVRQYEVVQILECIRCIQSGSMEEYVAQTPVFVSQYASFDFMSLGQAKNLGELIALLKKTPYAKVLEPLCSSGGEVEFSRFEQLLYSFLYQEEYRVIRTSFSKGPREQLLEMVGARAELLNIRTIYRLKRFYGYSPEQIRPFLIPMEGRLRRRLFEQMLNAPSAQEVERLFQESPYGRRGGEEGSIEHRSESIRCHINKKFITFATSVPVIFTAYLALEQMEIQNIITIIEGIKYQLSAEEMTGMLVY